MDDAMVGVFTVGQLDTLKRDPFLAQTGIAFFSGKINALRPSNNENCQGPLPGHGV